MIDLSPYNLFLGYMRFVFAALIAIFSLGITSEDAAAKRSVYRHIAAQPQANPKYSAFVVDGDTGKILYQEDADKLRYPASLTKMMTLYLLFEALENRKLWLSTKLRVSIYAASQPSTNLSMQPGDSISVEDAILGIVIKSANDAAVVVAETIGGSEDNFARLMTKRARQLGMKNTVFRNASGLHDPRQLTTAKDMALLGIALKKHFPQYFQYFSRKSFTYNGEYYNGHNRVMESYPGADGLKTGYVRASGFNLVTTASRRGTSLVGVVMGGRTQPSRDAQMVRLLDDGFQKAALQKSRSYIADTTPVPSTETYTENEIQQTTAATTASTTQLSDPIVEAAEAAEGDTTEEVVAPKPAPKKSKKSARKKKIALSKKKRYKSSIVVNSATSSTFVPYPKAKPKI